MQTGATTNASTVAIAMGATLQTNAANVFDPTAILNNLGVLSLGNHDQTIGRAHRQRDRPTRDGKPHLHRHGEHLRG